MKTLYDGPSAILIPLQSTNYAVNTVDGLYMGILNLFKGTKLLGLFPKELPLYMSNPYGKRKKIK